ncbi:MAG: glycosyltransferase [Patescibacteria group bacterium]
MKKIKVALVHDYIKEYGGAERVLEALHEIYPDADVYTSVYLPKFLGPHRKRFSGWKIKTTWFQHVPFNYKLLSPFRVISASVFGQFDFSSYDVVIVSATGAFFPNAIRKGKEVHICYCHTPPRYLYGYATARSWKKHKLVAAFATIANHFLRLSDFRIAQQVDWFIANSQEVSGRIRKFYRRDSTVIYPPVDISLLSFPRRRESRMEWIPGQARNDKSKAYYLAGGRLARAKHFDLIVQACTDLGVPLKVFGKSFAGYGEELQSLAGKTVAFVGEVNEEEKLRLMQGAKAFLFAAADEDFGITPVEAMACGIPVIAYGGGGVKETVIDGKTGIFFDKLTAEGLSRAIKRFEMRKQVQHDKMQVECKKQAEKFSKERFMKQIQAFVSAKVKQKKV